jgi:hypothetical protein
MAAALNLVGRKFGRLTVRSLAKPHGKKRRWLCFCDCSKTSIAFTHDLIRGAHQSCGCLQKERASATSTTHGRTKTREYEAWSRIIARCEDPAHPRFKDYGGRGIRICEQWRRSFTQFLSDVGPRPSKKHSIDRINNDGHYEPGNVRWSTATEQARNQRRSGRSRDTLGRFAGPAA